MPNDTQIYHKNTKSQRRKYKITITLIAQTNHRRSQKTKSLKKVTEQNHTNYNISFKIIYIVQKQLPIKMDRCKLLLTVK